MLDIGFAEILVVAILSLVIFGPERLPEAIKTIALWVGRFKRGYQKVRTDIEREIGAEDIRRQLHNEEIMQSLKDAQTHLNDPLDTVQDTIKTTASSTAGKQDAH